MKSFIKALFWPIIFGLGQLFIYFLLAVIFVIMDGDENEFEKFLELMLPVIILIESLIFIPLFYKVYKKVKPDNSNKKNINIFSIIVASLFLSLVGNLVIVWVKQGMGLEINSTFPSVFLIISAGIVGPILEELVFRGILFNKLKQSFSTNVSVHLSCLIFAVAHNNIFQILFAYIVGYLFIHLYQKYQDIRVAFLAHIVVNIVGLLAIPIIF